MPPYLPTTSIKLGDPVKRRAMLPHDSLCGFSLHSGHSLHINALTETENGIIFEHSIKCVRPTLHGHIRIFRASPDVCEIADEHKTCCFDCPNKSRHQFLFKISDRLRNMCVGFLTSKRELQTRPMKLLVWAILTASLIDIAVRPPLGTGEPAVWNKSVSTPRSLQSNTGSRTSSQPSSEPTH